MTQHKPIKTAAVGRRRIFPAALAGALAAIPLLSGFLGCSSASQTGSSTGALCDNAYKGECGKACKVDTDCATGLYCGAAGCTADCGPGHDCSEGSSCSDGRCLATGILGGGDSGLLGGGGALTANNACVNDKRTGEGIPSDIYIMNDRSLSMACAIPPATGDRWDAMKAALTGFLQSPSAAGLGVGLQYFGVETGKGPYAPSLGQGGNGGSCNPADYVNPAVEIAPLPGNAPALVSSLNRTTPATYTPTPAALQGAIEHAKAWATKNPDHAVSVVLATDGEPNLLLQGNTCAQAGQNAQQIQQYINQVAQIAKDAFAGTPKISTYVIGIIDGSGQCERDPQPPKQADLDVVAKAGGTNSAYIVSATSGNTSAEFLDALNKIRGQAVVSCQYVLPKTSVNNQTVDPDKVNITLTPGGGKEQELLQAPNAAGCPKDGGWYYQDPANPARIELCPASCNIVSADPNAAVQVLLGCKTDTGPIQ